MMKGLIRHNTSQNYMQNLQDEMTRLMEEVFGSDMFETGEKKMWRPPIEMSETDSAYEIKLQLPGFEKKDIDIEVGDDYITVKAENTFEKEVKKENLYRSEFKYGNFIRTVSFPSKIIPDKINAEFKNGVLAVSAAKAKPKAKTKAKPKVTAKPKATATAKPTAKAKAKPKVTAKVKPNIKK